MPDPTTIDEIARDEFNRAYKSELNRNYGPTDIAFNQLILDLYTGASFVETWINIFTLLADDRARQVTIDIFKRLDRPVPAKYIAEAVA